MILYKLQHISYTKAYTFCILILCVFSGIQSQAQVKASIDSTSVNIGAELQYTIAVAADSSQVVVFPEGQTFEPLEMVTSYEIDTTKHTKEFHFIKKYGLTQFDSGKYTIPRQVVLIGDTKVFTDSIQVEIRDIVVDTMKQKLYEIKPLVDVQVEEDSAQKNTWWMLLLGLIVIVGIVMFVFMKKKKKAREEVIEIPPYERAIQALQTIDESNLLEQNSHKEYYSQLSDTARTYIDEELYDHALESTTDELIHYLEEQSKYGTLDLDMDTVKALETVLKTADLAKFAKSKPIIEVARGHRNMIESVIHKTKEAIPEPTEEERMADEEFRRKALEKARKKKKRIIALVSLGIVTVALALFVWVKGVDTIRVMLFGSVDEKIEQIDWISSRYGFPGVMITTPEVLIRNNYETTKEQKEALKNSENFSAGSITGTLYTAVTSMPLDEKNKIDLEKAVESVVSSFEQQGGKNITVKTEEYETLEGVEGIKIFGSLAIKAKDTEEILKKEYIILNFGENGGFQQITVLFDIDDEYIKKVAERIINSVTLTSSDQ